VLPNIHYLLTDCKRDYDIAKKHGFVGEFLGVFPGGGGFPLEEMKAYLLPFDERNILLIKGFQGRSGRAIPVLKAVERMKESLSEYVIIVFGADKEVVVYADKSVLSRWNNFRIYGKLPQNEVFKWMGKSLIYIGNSNSDGMPNTLLEAICMEVFPIQSNPGGVTEELIVNEENALLINDCEDIDEIVTKLQQAVGNKEMVFKAIASNSKNIKPVLGSKHIKQLVIEKYKNLASNSLR
jgi:glycosyltransferase involved in cell wall biosynthesis